MHTTCQTNV